MRCEWFLFLLVFSFGEATQYQPWFGNPYEFEVRGSLLNQNYSRLSSNSRSIKYSTGDFFLNGSLSNALPTLGVELEAMGAWTKKQRGDLDQLKLTGKYLWSDDVAGDLVSLATGISYIQAFQHSVHDVSSFHHGSSEAEIFITLGKEKAVRDFWASRWWGMLGIGTSFSRGSPWIRFHAAYEKSWGETHLLLLFADTLWGLGNKRLVLPHFHGYRRIGHQSIDLGLRYTYLIDFFGSVSLQYSYRIWARNFPEQTHRVMAEVLYTFGL